MVKILYKLFLAVMISLFLGFGVSVFYPAPKGPEYPTVLEKISRDDQSEEQRQAENKFQEEQKIFTEKLSDYNRNVSAIILALSVLLLIISLSLVLKVDIFSDGLMLSGIFTLLYGMIRGLMSNNNQFQFVVVTVGLVVALALGYLKFVKPGQKESI